MTSFELDISEKDLASARYITAVQRRLIGELVRKGREKGLTRTSIARTLGIEKSTVSRMLNGKNNLTARSIAELCWALEIEPELVTRDLADMGRNIQCVEGATTGRAGATAGYVEEPGVYRYPGASPAASGTGPATAVRFGAVAE